MFKIVTKDNEKEVWALYIETEEKAQKLIDSCLFDNKKSKNKQLIVVQQGDKE